MERNIPKNIINLAKEVRIDTEGRTKEEIFAELDKVDPQWVDEVQSALETPITEEEIRTLWRKGYNFVNLFYLSTYGISYIELKNMTPAEVDEMADQLAQTDDKLLGC